MSEGSPLKFARTAAGYRLRVDGKGTMRESRSTEAFVNEVLTDEKLSVVVDLSVCTYLDSTFLGCLFGLSTKFGRPKFIVAAPADSARKLFGPTRMDLVLKVSHDLPDIVGDFCPLSADATNATEMKRHIMECHRRLAEIPGPQQNAFAAIAQQMEKELGETT